MTMTAIGVGFETRDRTAPLLDDQDVADREPERRAVIAQVRFGRTLRKTAVLVAPRVEPYAVARGAAVEVVQKLERVHVTGTRTGAS